MSRLKKQKEKAYVAMSGGVDSSVAAALLAKRGFDVVGVFMKPWQPKSSFCLWQKDREDAMRVASKLGIPLLTWDFSKEYKKEVTDYMLREYKAGRTPNPDVMCNKHIKFGLFLEKALKEGADYIATGHYVRLRQNSEFRILNFEFNSKFKIKNLKLRLLKAKDTNKDQSYFLWTLTQGQLKHCLFPIGDYTKSEVRKLAKKFDLPTADKKDSQGVCFIGPLDMKEFLKKYIKPKTGMIYHTNGELLGTHDGAHYYTIGQRHGLNIKNGKGPYYVVKKDTKKNVIYVGPKDELSSRTLKLTDLNWIHGGLKLPTRISVKIRYRSKSVPVIIKKEGSVYILRATHYALHATTSGQSAVFYRGNELIGGGIIR